MSAPDVGSSVPPSASPPLRVLELFSGIGGMHFALREAGTNATVVASMDVSDVANAGEGANSEAQHSRYSLKKTSPSPGSLRSTT